MTIPETISLTGTTTIERVLSAGIAVEFNCNDYVKVEYNDPLNSNAKLGGTSPFLHFVMGSAGTYKFVITQARHPFVGTMKIFVEPIVEPPVMTPSLL